MQDAPQVARTWKVFTRLTGADLLRELVPVLLRIARLVARFRRAEPSPEETFRLENELQNLLREVGRLIFQWTINHLEPPEKSMQDMPTQFFFDGEYYRRRSKSRLRSLHCLFGPITLSRFYYQPLERKGRGLFPLELQLGIVVGVATPALADCVAQQAVDLTQRQTLHRLRLQGIVWGTGTLRKVTAAMAESLSEHRHRIQVRQLLEWMKLAQQGTGPRRPVLSVGRDGVMIPIVKSQKYREAAAATVSVMDRRGRRLGTVYLGQMPQAHQTRLSDELTHLLQDVLTAWKEPLPRLVYVTDCGHHPTEYFERTLARMVNPRRPGECLPWEWIVDYYHACQYISKLAEAIFGRGREATAWAVKQRRILLEKPGGVFRVLRSAGALLARRGLIGKEDDYWSAYLYLRNRASKMDYPTYRRLRMPIGSGITEAACKILFAQRFKQSGMKWTLEGGRPILALRVIHLSGIWDQVRDASMKDYQPPQPVTPKRLDEKTDKIRREIAV